MPERGVDVSHETIRRWCVTFGFLNALVLRRRLPRPVGICHLDEIVLKIAGRPAAVPPSHSMIIGSKHSTRGKP
jgi:transposase-like protein